MTRWYETNGLRKYAGEKKNASGRNPRKRRFKQDGQSDKCATCGYERWQHDELLRRDKVCRDFKVGEQQKSEEGAGK